MIKILLLSLIFLTGSIQKDKVRYGTVAEWESQGKPTVPVVDSKKVYLEIPAYKTIIKEKLTRGQARYNSLIVQATKTYKSKLKDLSKKHSYIIIVEKGGVTSHPVKDITSNVIDLLKSTKGESLKVKSQKSNLESSYRKSQKIITWK